jgi:hypothetical protein
MHVVPFHISIGSEDNVTFALYVSTPSKSFATPVVIPEDIIQLGIRLLQPQHLEPLGDAAALGRTLGSILFPAVVRDILVSSAREAHTENGRIQIQLQIAVPELAALPWEWAVIEGTRSWAPSVNEDYGVVRMSSVSEPAPPIGIDGPLNVLMCVPPNQKSEYSAIHTLLQSEIAEQRIHVNIVEIHGLADLNATLSRDVYHVVHLVGDVSLNHDQYMNITFGAEIDVFELQETLSQYNDIGLVCVTCSSIDEPQIRAIPQIFAALLLSRTINAAITFSGISTPDIIVRFAATCYNAIIDDTPLDLAVTRGRRALTSGRRDTSWGLPQLRIVPGTERLFLFEPPRDPWRWIWSVTAVIGIAAAIVGAILLGRFLVDTSATPTDTPPAIVMPTPEP